MVRLIRRHGLTAAVAVVAAVTVAGLPVGAHVTTSAKHSWKHLKRLADTRYVLKRDLASHQANGTHSRLQVSTAGSTFPAVDVQGGSPGLAINASLGDGIRIAHTNDDGIQVGDGSNYPNNGLYIPSPGVPTYGLWPNTANPAGEWALYTVDSIKAGNVTAFTQSIVARVADGGTLRAGDVAAAAGLSGPVRGGHQMLALVEAAGAEAAAGIIGVVEGRMVTEQGPGKNDVAIHSAAGPAEPGDLVAITVLGVAGVRVASSDGIVPGLPVTLAGSGGGVRSLGTSAGDNADAPVVGIALAAPNANGTVPVFVSPR